MTEEKRTKWVIMAYLAGDNDLPAFCISVLQQLEEVKYNDDVCVLACFDSGIPWTKGSRYFSIHCDHRKINKPYNWEIHNDLVSPRRSEANNGDEDGFSRPTVTEGLSRFIGWTMREHGEADRYMLVLYGHGPVVAGQNFLRTENPPSFLRLEDLRDVLSDYFGGDFKKLDILAFQNCVMNGIEVAYEIREQADWMIGSQGLVLATGWPYKNIMKTIVKQPKAEPKDIARDILKACARHMLDFAVMDRSSEQSMCDLQALDRSNITRLVSALAEVLGRALDFELKDEKRVLRYPAIVDAVKLARLEAQAFYGELFVDLFDFCERLLMKCNDIVRAQNALVKELQPRETARAILETSLVKIASEIVVCCLNVRDAVTQVVPESYYIGSHSQYSHGLSIYFPWTRPSGPYFPTPMRNGDFWLRTAFSTYQETSFVKASRWDRFLEAFFDATLRNVRRSDRDIVLTNPPNLDIGLVTEIYHPPSEFLPGGDPQKSSPDTGGPGDFDFWSQVKNYPRRGYLSPADSERQIDNEIPIKRADFKQPTSPPVSAWGWNIAGLVADVIRKGEGSGSREPRPKEDRAAANSQSAQQSSG